MIDRRFLLEATVLIVASLLVAVVANAVAPPERKVAWVGKYRNALTVPQRPAAVPPATVLTPGVVAPQDEFPAAVTETTLMIPTETVVPLQPSAAAAQQPATSAAQSTAPAAGAQPAPEAPLTQLFPPAPDRPAVEITGEQAVLLHRRGALFFDARRSSAYAEGHIPGAIHVSPWEGDLEDKIRAIYEMGIASDAPLIVYCTGGACEDSHMIAERLWGIELNNVLVYTDGWPDWIARGLPVVRGARR
jgi:rhodanese-related sulfurtransferase